MDSVTHVKNMRDRISELEEQLTRARYLDVKLRERLQRAEQHSAIKEIGLETWARDVERLRQMEDLADMLISYAETLEARLALVDPTFNGER